jgi:cytochrome c
MTRVDRDELEPHDAAGHDRASVPRGGDVARQRGWPQGRTYARIALLGLLAVGTALSACNAQEPGQAASGAEAGAQIFQQRCAPCHATSSEQKVGPGLAGLFAPGGPQLPNGIDYDGKLPNGAEITEANVAVWIRKGGQGQLGSMPGTALDDQQMADLLAYLKTLE